MNPTIEAAWIGALTGGVGLIGVVTVAISGNRNARKTNSQTIEAGTASMVRTLDAARDDKLWDKQTATYEEIIAYLLFIQAKRRLERRRRFLRYNTEYEEASERLLGDYKPASWWEMQARLAAYGSPETHANRSQAPEQAPDIKEIQAVRGAVDEAHKQADETDQALVKVMRDELNRKPSQGGAVSVPASGSLPRRGWRFLHRASRT